MDSVKRSELSEFLRGQIQRSASLNTSQTPAESKKNKKHNPGCCAYKLDELCFVFFFKQIHNLNAAAMENTVPEN